MVAPLPSEGVETHMLVVFELGRSHPEMGIKGVQPFLYTVCILYIVICTSIQDTEGLYVQYRSCGCTHNTEYSYNL